MRSQVLIKLKPKLALNININALKHLIMVAEESFYNYSRSQEWLIANKVPLKTIITLFRKVSYTNIITCQHKLESTLPTMSKQEPVHALWPCNSMEVQLTQYSKPG